MKTLAEIKFMILTSEDPTSIDKIISSNYDFITFREKIAFLKGMFNKTIIGKVDIDVVEETYSDEETHSDEETCSDEKTYFAILNNILASANRDNRCVRKNLSIPTWLNTMALESNINFSNVLQEALKEKLGLK